MIAFPLVDLPFPGAHKLTVAEFNAILAQNRVAPFGPEAAADFAALPTAPPATPQTFWNNGGTLAMTP